MRRAGGFVPRPPVRETVGGDDRRIAPDRICAGGRLMSTDATGRKEVAEAVLTAVLTTAATVLVTWGFEAAQEASKQHKKSASKHKKKEDRTHGR